MKGDQRNAALKVMLVSCSCHRNDPVFIFFHQLTNFTFSLIVFLFYIQNTCEQRCLHDLNAVSILFLLQQLISSLHDICQYLCAHARLGSSHARLGSQKLEFSGVTADWGGTEGIGEYTAQRKPFKQPSSQWDVVYLYLCPDWLFCSEYESVVLVW